MKKPIALGAALAGALVLLAAPISAQATSLGSFQINESIDTNTPGTEPPLTTFTSDIPGCGSGVFNDDTVHASHDGNFVIETAFVCDSGDVISARKEVHQGRTGEIQITGGTGAYSGISGNGKDVPTGESSPGVFTATVSGVLRG